MPPSPAQLFPRRIRSAAQAMRALPFRRLAPSDGARHFDETLNAAPGESPRLFYVHIPFCRNICDFCGYNRALLPDRETVRSWVDALERHIIRLAKTGWAREKPFRAVYFGGGSPTALPVEDLARILETIRDTLPVDEAEITVESCIADIGREGLGVLRTTGFNRISFGVQTFDTEIRRAVGRESDRETILDRLAEARDAGFANICVDLMYCLPGQTDESWRADCETLPATSATGCSVYPLIVFPHSALGAIQSGKGGVNYPCDPDMEYGRFIMADEIIGDTDGWERFTPVQYGLNGTGDAVYVREYADGADVLAAGAGGVSRIGGTMFVNPAGPEAFRASEPGVAPGPTAMTIDSGFASLSHLLFLTGRMRIGADEVADSPARYGSMIGELEEQGLVETYGDVVELTRDGRYWAGNIAAMTCEIIAEEITGISNGTKET